MVMDEHTFLGAVITISASKRFFTLLALRHGNHLLWVHLTAFGKLLDGERASMDIHTGGQFSCLLVCPFSWSMMMMIPIPLSLVIY